MHIAQPTNHVLVDFENVCKIDPTIFQNKNVTLTLLLGAGQTKLDVALVEQLLLNAASVRLVSLTSRGKNALDFTLAYYLGQAVVADPTGCFHLVSKDTGFDPLVEHLQSKNRRVHRHDDFGTLTFTPQPKSTTVAQPVTSATPKSPPKAKTAGPRLDGLAEQALAHLRRILPATRPKSRETLVRFLVTHFGTSATEVKAESIIENLSHAGKLAVDTKGTVNYWLA